MGGALVLVVDVHVRLVKGGEIQGRSSWLFRCGQGSCQMELLSHPSASGTRGAGSCKAELAGSRIRQGRDGVISVHWVRSSRGIGRREMGSWEDGDRRLLDACPSISFIYGWRP